MITTRTQATVIGSLLIRICMRLTISRNSLITRSIMPIILVMTRIIISRTLRMTTKKRESHQAIIMSIKTIIN
jgi:hypothetical protein